MSLDHPEAMAPIRLFLALSAIAHLLVLAWNTSLPVLPGRADETLFVTLDGVRKDATARPAAERPHAFRTNPDSATSRTTAPETATAPAAVPGQATSRTSPGDGDEQAATRAWLRSRLLANLTNHFHYPAIARRHGWEGTVLLGLRVEPDGHLDGIRLERSSGYAVLDHSALNSLRRIGNLGEARAWLEGRSVDLQLPVIYRLIDN